MKKEKLTEKHKLTIHFACYLTLIIAFMVLGSSMTSYIIYGMVEYMLDDPPEETKVFVNISELNADEQMRVRAIVEDIDPKYLVGQKEIRVTKDISQIAQKDYHFNEEDSKLILGFHIDGVNVIEYHTNEYVLRGTICHELLH